MAIRVFVVQIFGTMETNTTQFGVYNELGRPETEMLSRLFIKLILPTALRLIVHYEVRKPSTLSRFSSKFRHL